MDFFALFLRAEMVPQRGRDASALRSSRRRTVKHFCDLVICFPARFHQTRSIELLWSELGFSAATLSARFSAAVLIFDARQRPLNFGGWRRLKSHWENTTDLFDRTLCEVRE